MWTTSTSRPGSLHTARCIIYVHRVCTGDIRRQMAAHNSAGGGNAPGAADETNKYRRITQRCACVGTAKASDYCQMKLLRKVVL